MLQLMLLDLSFEYSIISERLGIMEFVWATNQLNERTSDEHFAENAV